MDEYAGLAEWYDPLLEPFLGRIRGLVRDACAAHGYRRVIDLGCGTGRQCAVLHKAGLDVEGVDLSPSMIAVARRATAESIVYHHADAAKFPIPQDRFDAAVISLALHEMPNETREAVLDNALTGCGAVVCFDYAVPSGWTGRIMGWGAHVPERLAGPRHYAGFRDFQSRDGIDGLVRRRGARVLARHAVWSGAAALLVCSRNGAGPTKVE